MQAAVDVTQREARAQTKQLAAPAPRSLSDVARGGTRVPPQRRVVLGLAREAERAAERGEHGLQCTRLQPGQRHTITAWAKAHGYSLGKSAAAASSTHT